MDRFTGGCLCSDIRIVSVGTPMPGRALSLLDCRRHHRACFPRPRYSLRMQ